MRVLAAVAVVLSGAWIVYFANYYQLDLEVYRIGVDTWLTGGNIYETLPKTSLGFTLPFIYPPISAVAMIPLTVVSFPVASAVMAFLTVTLAAVTMAVALPALRLSRNWLVLLPALLFLEPFRSTLFYGQVNVVLMAMVAADCLVRTPRWPRGALVGVAAALKLTPAAFILFFLLRRDWKSLRNAGISFAAATGAGFLFAWDESVEFWTKAVFTTGEKVGVGYEGNQSILGALTRVDTTWLWPVLAVAVIALAVAGMRRVDGPLAFAVNALAMLLVSPISWSHHWVWCLPVLLVFFAYGQRTLALGGAVVFFAAPHWWTDSFLVNTYLYYAVLALVVVSMTTRTRLRADPTAAAAVASTPWLRLPRPRARGSAETAPDVRAAAPAPALASPPRTLD
ncbi:glycosyltransferase 87 family protein [Actinokineospora sp. NBRC 105648]|uniref:glycosyltransferase 87 family protein n=1 Tax=Actinokineospora sp. NBRC 105648 TaxID=3032206 RepID=UPI0024A33FEE|nr:glycosyltransferase 87 family protein [Actinokineospora sp. NBRC 105648]GLZ37044.1 hypothetical protein Acsp05_06690 [Actinokineospora sp. NBRC 105648]